MTITSECRVWFPNVNLIFDLPIVCVGEPLAVSKSLLDGLT